MSAAVNEMRIKLNGLMNAFSECDDFRPVLNGDTLFLVLLHKQ